MATVKEIKIKADTSEARKDVQGFTDDIKDLGDESKKTSEEVEDIGEAGKKAGKGTGVLSKGIKSVGTAFKALGIGIILGLLAKLAEILSRNQKVVDFFTTAMTSLELVFNDLFSFVSDNFMPAFENLKKFFENFTFAKFKKAIKENIQERFESLLDTLGFVGKAFKKLFQGDFSGAFDEIKNAGKEMVDVLTGVPNTVDRITDTVTDAIDSMTEYAKATITTAKAMTELKNTAELAAVAQQGLIEKNDILAEKQRQIRDNDLENINVRIKANEELKKVLDDQEKAMLRNADLVIASAQANLRLNNSIENQVSLQQALNEKVGVTAQVEGFRSEQIVNTISLLKERMEIERAGGDADLERQLEQLKFNASQEEFEVRRIEKLIEINELEKELRAEQLEDQINSFKEGTQARIDSEIELNDFLQANANERIQLEADQGKEDVKLTEAVRDAKIEIIGQVFNIASVFAKKGSKVAKGLAVAEATINTFKGVTSALSAPTTIPDPFGTPLRFANAAAVAAAGFANVRNILSTDESGSSAPSGGGGVSPSAPSFNLVQGTGTNQIAEGLQSGDTPIKAFVVSSDVSTSQEADRKIVEGASLG